MSPRIAARIVKGLMGVFVLVVVAGMLGALVAVWQGY